jgi:hypothetical protein
MSPGMTVLERLAALEDIKLLKARRDRFLDTKDWDALEQSIVRVPHRRCDCGSRAEHGRW